jgi:acyl-CoA thioesterase
MQSIAQILTSLESKSGVYRAIVGDDWLQGRTVFGGLIAALANVAMRNHVPPDRPLRALQIVYVGPNASGALDFEPQVLREGKAVTLSSCTIRSNNEVSATVTAMYGVARESALNIRPNAELIDVQPDSLPDLQKRPEFAPGFTQHYQQRWARGGLPFTQATDSRMSVYVRYCDNTQKLTETHALALMDAIPSPALALLRKPSPASTLSWTLEILDHKFDFDHDAWWRLDADVDASTDGYVTHSSHVVNPAGRVAAISRQVVVIYG